MKEITIDDRLVRRVLGCFDFKRLTKDELEKKYDRLYPPSVMSFSIHELKRAVTQKYSTHKTSEDFKEVLQFLCKEGYCNSQLTSVTDQTLENDVHVYFLSEKGKSVISKKK